MGRGERRGGNKHLTTSCYLGKGYICASLLLSLLLLVHFRAKKSYKIKYQVTDRRMNRKETRIPKLDKWGESMKFSYCLLDAPVKKNF